MNRDEMRAKDWEIKDHNRVFDDAEAIWSTTASTEAVIHFLREKNWTDGEVIGFLTRRLNLGLDAARDIITRRPKGVLLVSLMTVGFALISGCKSAYAPAPTTAIQPVPAAKVVRPTTPPPPIHLFHQTSDSITLTTTPDATDQQIAAILWQLRDAAHNHTFDAHHIPQKLVDARSPNVWFHLYRGPKCAPEKYAPGAPPCGPSYHAAGDYTLGSLHDPNWDSGVLLTPSTTDDPHETNLWPPGSPYIAPNP